MSEVKKESNGRRMSLKIVTVAGGVAMLMPCSLPWYWGDMSSYCLSYIAVVNGDIQYLDSPFVTAIFFTSWVCLMLLNNILCKYIARRWILLTGLLSSISGFVVSYVTIEKSFLAFSLCLGLFQGLGTGLIYGNVVHLVVSVADTDVGLLTAILQGSFSLGPIFITLLMTLYTNPNNHAPTFKIGSTLYFTQRNVLDRVPSMYLVLGIFSSTLYFVGFVLMQFNSNTGFKFSKNPQNAETGQLVVSDQNKQSYGSDSCNMRPTTGGSKLCINDTTEQSLQETAPTKCSDSVAREYTPKEVLKTPVFYAIWLCFFIEDISFLLLTNYYKLYGQLYIHDDYFFAKLGTTFLVCGGGCRILWGISVDRYGVKNCSIALTGSITILSLFFCFTALLSRWLYFFFTVCFVIVATGFYGTFLAAVSKLFGKENVAVNYGLVLTSSLLWNGISPVVVGYCLEHMGWFKTFMTGGILSFFSLLMVIFQLPKF